MSHLKLDSRREMARPVHPIADYLFGRENIPRHADWLAVALPWSTSMTLAFIVLWLLALLASAASQDCKCPGDRVLSGAPIGRPVSTIPDPNPAGAAKHWRDACDAGRDQCLPPRPCVDRAPL